MVRVAFQLGIQQHISSYSTTLKHINICSLFLKSLQIPVTEHLICKLLKFLLLKNVISGSVLNVLEHPLAFRLALGDAT